MTDPRKAVEDARHAAAEALHSRLYDGVDGLYGNATFEANAVIDAFLAKLNETHCVVPREPTIGMLRALVASWPKDASVGIWTLGSFREDYWTLGSFREDYQAMLEAASSSPHEIAPKDQQSDKAEDACTHSSLRSPRRCSGTASA